MFSDFHGSVLREYMCAEKRVCKGLHRDRFKNIWEP